MKKFLLNLEAPINGVYLNSETIELLSIIQCNSIEELRDFAINCSQLNISEQTLQDWNDSNIEDIKRNLVEQYKKTLIPMEQSIRDKLSVLKSILEHTGITIEEIENPKNYTLFAERSHRFIGSERDQMTHVTYEELLDINNVLHNHNTILVASGRYYDVTNAMYNKQIPDMKRYDFYYAQRGLDFCYKNGMNARYHALLDKQTMDEHLIGQTKEEVLKELQEYVKQSINFISKYNEEHKIDGKGLISSVDLFNEIISFDEPYRNMWQHIYGISTEELVEVFKYAKENKPEGVTYVYNEPFLENPERRQVVIEQLLEIDRLSPGLIDTIGTQMHIEMTQNMEDIRQCFCDLKKLEELGIRTQITEFDMCLPERFMFDENGKARSEQELVALTNSKLKGITVGSIAEFKSIKMSEISKAIAETDIKLNGITYWSISDTLDHNLQRTNRKTIKQGLNRDIAITRYAGLYSELGKNRTISIQKLGKETLEEQNDIILLDRTERVMESQIQSLEKQKEEQEL